MSKIDPKTFEIQNKIDMGSEGKFNPNEDMEPQLADKLNGMKDGKKEFDRLVRRGAVDLKKPSTVPPEPQGEEDGETFEAKGKYYKEHYGGGNYKIVSPSGKSIEKVTKADGGREEAQRRVDELNGELDEEE